jgi:hypothetical protein
MHCISSRAGATISYEEYGSGLALVLCTAPSAIKGLTGSS